MNHNRRLSAVIAVSCAIAGVGLVGCEESTKSDSDASATRTTAAPKETADESAFTGAKKFEIDGRSVNVSCSGAPADDRPVIVLMAGGGDGLEKMAGIQKTLSGKNRVCSYDRLGEGTSDQPDGTQTIRSTGKVLTSVIDRVAGDRPVVLAGHSLGGLIAARYAPDHRDRVKGLVLMDATSPTQTADLNKGIPESATGPAAELRAQTLAILQGGKPERLMVPDGEVRSAGDIPVEVIQHGKRYLEQVPDYGPDLERAWSNGQRAWRGVSSRSRLSTATESEHYIYVDQPDVAVRAIERVTSQAADRA
ncbi:alpha/beta fold hydrolase [Streptomyces malaysiensis]|uniref:Alpha/beta hydrolase n=1 Tax=Streptomyces malaysiensis TaxID=92644 RepID=A0A7X5X0Q9_STRMQ|nr:alpha/beta hydrolase [Streptomyces malaysiensis]NIY63700.1 alpha/beta hydrolase [Streptomyces malaysiensis]